MNTPSLQQRYAPKNACFGCGHANPKGLRIASYRDADDPSVLVATWTPEPHHEAFPGVLNGGIIGALLDCHCNWTASIALMDAHGSNSPPCTVTARYAIELKRPTPSDVPLSVRGWVKAIDGDKVEVEGTLEAGGKVCATCTGTFIAVKPGHPAYHRW